MPNTARTRKPDEPRFSVRGRVLDARGKGLARLQVELVALDLAGAHFLARATTGTDGAFELKHRGTASSSDGAPNLDARIEVRRGKGERLGQSPILFALTAHHVVDVLVGAASESFVGLTELEQLQAALASAGDVPPLPTLDATGLELLAQRADVFPLHLARLVQASRLAEAAALPVAPLYGLLRAGLPPALPDLVLVEAPQIREAIMRAHRTRVVPTPNDPEADTDVVVARIAALRIEAAMLPGDPEFPSGRDLLGGSGVAEPKVRTFVEAWLAHDGPRETFFTELASSPLFDPDDVRALEFTVKAAALTGHFGPALEQLQSRRRDGELRAVEDLAAWNTDRWVHMLTPVGAPAAVVGGTEAERVRRYAEGLMRVVEAEYPTRVLSHRLADEAEPPLQRVATFLDEHPGFAIERSIVPVFAAAHEVQLDATLEADLKRVQRVYALTPPLQRAEITRRLLGVEVGSATEIVQLGRAAFVERAAGTLAELDPNGDGQVLAARVYERARLRNGVAVALLTQYAAPMHAVHVPATEMAQLQWAAPVAATLENLFGNQDFCACEHCKSQFGPAAYLVDLLAQLRAAPAVSLPSALAVLRGLRPDLPRIELSCVNTNTVMPYIDLVTELLEQVAEGIAPLQARQTTWSAAELRVHPEHVRDSAYVGEGSPATAVFPWSLPFELPTTETRDYLESLGTPRGEAMRILTRELPAPDGVLDAPEHADAVAEAFGLTRLGLQTICGGSAYEASVVQAPSVAEAWGLAAGVPIPDDARSVLRITGLDYEGLEELLELGYISPPIGPVLLRFADDVPSCDLDDISLLGLTDAAASRIHRFLRLLAQVPLTEPELNFATATIGGGALDYAFVRGLAALLRLMDRANLELEEAVALVSGLPTRAIGSTPSLYARLFLDRRIDGEPDPAFVLEGGGGDPTTTMAVVGAGLQGHREAIRGALRVSDSDFDRLVGELGLSALNHANLSTLYQHTRLARAVGVPIVDALRLFRLLAIDPFDNPVDTLAYVEAAQSLADLPLSIEVIDYVCRHQVEEGSDVALGGEATQAFVQQLDEGVVAIDARLDVGGAASVALAEHLAALLAGPSDVSRAIALLGVPGGLSVAQQAELTTLLESAVAAVGGAVAAVAALVGPDGDANLQARAAVLLPLVAAFRRDAEIDLLLSKLLGDLGQLDPAAALRLAAATVQHDGQPARAALLGDDASARVAALTRWFKVALLVRELSVRTEDLPWFFEAPLGPQSLDPAMLPLDPQEDAGVLVRRVEALALGQRFRHTLSWPGNALAEASAAGSLEAAVAIVAEAAGWHSEDVAWAASDALLSMAASDLADPFLVERIEAVMGLVRRSGVHVAQLVEWVRGVATADSVRALKRAVRARYGEAQWADAVTPVSDRIREAKRDALVALLVGRGDATSPQALYDRLLVDPQMNACMLTSRIKLAISSCQLFVQRGLLGLEASQLRFSEEFGRVWWRSRNYRVWEALRRVFFYPENWVEPDLRLHKTPLYEAFESDLDQGELGEETVNRAFRNYLYGLDAVSHLEIVSVYQEPPPSGDDGFWPTGTVHVIGRSRDEPRSYFYRRRLADLMWTPWEAIELEIAADAIAVAQFNGRTYLFWAELEPIPYNEDDDVLEDVGRDYRCRLSWSERRTNGWSTSKSVSRRSRQFIPTRRIVNLTVRATSSALRVAVLRYSTTSEPTPVHLKVLWGFRYDWCADSLVPAGLSTSERERLGLPLSRVLDGPRQQSDETSDLHMVTGWYLGDEEIGDPFVDQTPTQRAVLRDVSRDFHVTQSYQRPIYESLTPAVFDDGKHALYMVPYRTPGPAAVPLVAGNELDDVVLEPGAEPPSGGRTPSEGLRLSEAARARFAEPWGGATPGLRLRTDTVAPIAEASAILASAVRTTEAPVALSPSLVATVGGVAGPGSYRKWRLDNFNHPYTCVLIKALHAGGVDAVLAGSGSLRRQVKQFRYLAPDPEGSQYAATSDALLWTDPKNEFDFRFGSAYGQYNWELFFHIPLAIAERFRREQRFEEAAQWFHYIFDPQQGQTPGDPPTAARFWKMGPLFDEANEGPNDVIKAIFTGGDLEVDSGMVQSFVASVWAWLLDPLDPHGIARMRSGTYRWVVVRKYLDNLLDWGDWLFRRDTIESINEATQLYLLAAAILGRKPEQIAAHETENRTFDELEAPALFGGLVELESFDVGGPVPPPLDPTFTLGELGGGGGAPPGELTAADDIRVVPPPPPPAPLWWYFCLPPNDQLLAYWDTVADRLFKIRNCQNIDGIRRQLALFAPPIDPALLVRARAAGVSIDSVLSDLHGPVPIHRYRTLLARALEMCGDVRALGAALLSALERRDGETLAQLRAEHEVALHRRTKDVRTVQLREAEEQRKVLAAETRTVTQRRDFYKNRKRISAKESRHRKALWVAMGLDIAGAAAKAVGASLKIVSAKKESIAEGLIALAETLSIGGIIARTVGQQAVTQAGYERRGDEWTHQEQQADAELHQIEARAAATEIRIALAQRELDNTERQIADAQAVEAFMRSKYTGAQLYNWMVGQLSGLYFQSYKLAFDLARAAERALQRELVTDETFVRFDAWDNLKRGLLAGERLQLDLRRLDAAHRALDRREYELTKRISLRAVDPAALVDLREDGSCVFELPEVLFDLDHPGHYLRRIKSVSMTIPAVVGPHTSVGARLVLERHRTRVDATSAGAYAEQEDDTRFEYGFGGPQAVATSRARDDAGLFELNLNEERRLPFEGSGVISRWRIDLPAAHRQFDYTTISDVQLQIAYTAREGGDGLRAHAEASMTEMLNAAAAQVEAADGGLAMMLSANRDFPVDWERFLRPTGEPLTTLSVPIVADRFPYVWRQAGLTVTGVQLVIVSRNGTSPVGAERTVAIGPATEATTELALTADDAPTGAQTFAETVTATPWVLDVSGLQVDAPDDLLDLLLVVHFAL